MQSADYPEVPDDFGHWLAGFIDGEGSFYIAPNRKHYICRMSLRLRDDDVAMLNEIRHRTGIGQISRLPPKRPECGGEVTWVVASSQDCCRLIELLDMHPLRAKKARDYAIWREGVRLCATARRGNGAAARNSALWATMAILNTRLREGRRYAGHSNPAVLEIAVVDPVTDQLQLAVEEGVELLDVAAVPLRED